MLVDGNVFEENWGNCGQQRATGIVLTPRNQSGKAPWSVVKDVTFINNIVRHVGIGFRLTGSDDAYPSQQTERILIENSLWDDVRSDYYETNTGFGVAAFSRGYPVKDLRITHNTVLFPPGSKGAMLAYFGDSGKVMQDCVIENNIFMHGNNGIIGNATGPGLKSLKHWLVDFSFAGNVMVSRPIDHYYRDITAGFSRFYGDNNFNATSLDAVGFVDYGHGNYRLGRSSPYRHRGTDGKDPGLDFNALQDATRCSYDGLARKPSASLPK